MKTLFRFLRLIATSSILIILVNSFGWADWHTWTIYVLTFLAMLFDLLYNEYGGYDDD